MSKTNKMSIEEQNKALDEILTTAKKINSNAQIFRKPNGNYVLAEDTEEERVSYRTQIWMSAEKITVFSGCNAQIFNSLEQTYSVNKKDGSIQQRIKKFESAERVNDVLSMLAQYINKETKKTTTKKVTTNKKKEIKTA